MDDATRWLGRRESQTESISPAHVDRIRSTLGPVNAWPDDELPPLWHWGFLSPAASEDQLGAEGHVNGTGLVAVTPDLQRMWAGGSLTWHAPIKIDEVAVRQSEVVAVRDKQGRQGPLRFVTVAHRYHQASRCCVEEEQILVYRPPSAPRLEPGPPPPPGQWAEIVVPTPVMLFRYSAVTFNGHRIHYDWPYATKEEGYPGLVVHGPLTLTLSLMAFLRAHPFARPHHLTYRNRRPLISPHPFRVCGSIRSAGEADLYAAHDEGIAQTAQLTFRSSGEP